MGCDNSSIRRSIAGLSFNPRIRVGCDYKVMTTTTQSIRFQSAHLHEVRFNVCCYRTKPQGVSIRAPTRGAIFCRWKTGVIYSFQSAHLHEVRFPRLCKLTLQIEVSIRAPAWGAIIKRHFLDSFLHVSIRAPAWGAIVNFTLTNLNLGLTRQFRVYLAHQSPL